MRTPSNTPSPSSNIGYMSGREKLSGLISEEETVTNNSAASRKVEGWKFK